MSLHIFLWCDLSRWKLWSLVPTQTTSWKPQFRWCPYSTPSALSVAYTVIRSEGSAFRCLWSLVVATNLFPCSGTLCGVTQGTLWGFSDIRIRSFFSGLVYCGIFYLWHITARRSSAFFKMHLPIVFPYSSSLRSMRKSKQLKKLQWYIF